LKIDHVVERYITKGKQFKLLVMTSLIWMIGAAGVMVLTFAVPDIISEWKISSTIMSTIISSTFMGMLIGAISSGILIDLFGRKSGTIFYLTCSIVFTFLFGFSNSPQVAVLLRFLSGIGYGGLLPAVNTYLSEYTSIKIRGRYLVLLESSWAVGSILIAWFAVTFAERFGWRWNFWIFLIGCAIFPFILSEKETPKYIFKKYGKERLEKSFGKIDDHIESIEESRITLASLFAKRHLKKTLLVMIAWFTVSFVYYALFSWAPKIFISQLGISVAQAKWFTFFMYIAQLPGYLSVAYLIEKIGRKLTLSLYFTGMGISSLSLFLVSGDVSFLTIMLIISFFTLGVWGMVYAYTPELFPTSFRGTANGFAGAMARVAGIIAPYFTGYFIDKSIFIALIVITIMSLITGFLVFPLGVETKDKAIN